MGDAIVRTLCRLLVTRRHLLEWVPAAQATIGPRLDLVRLLSPDGRRARDRRRGRARGLVCRGTGHGRWPLPFAALWLASPAVARWVSLSPRVAGQLPLSDADAAALRLTARRTWRFFETFVTPADNMLPPDNFQEDPAPALAHRTSPTNLGLYLLSVGERPRLRLDRNRRGRRAAGGDARDHERLARFRGHFYNWYDTRDLRPLDPQYVSSVDSGNLAGHLIALANACREWRALPPDAAARVSPASPTRSSSTREEAARLRDGRRTQTVTWRQLDDALAALASAVRQPLARRRRYRDTARRARRRGRDHGRHRPGARHRARRRYRRGHAVLGAGARRRSIESHRRDLGRRRTQPRSLRARLAALEDTARAMALAMEFGFLLDHDRKLLSIGYLVRRRRARPELLRSAGLRGAARELLRHRQGRRSGPPLVPSRPRRDPGRAWRRADLVVGIDVRISDAVAGHARAGRKPARADQPADRAAPDRLRGDAAACPGAFRNPPTTPAIWSSPINIPISAFPASA